MKSNRNILEQIIRADNKTMDLNQTITSITQAATDAAPLIAQAAILASHEDETASLMGDRLATESQGNVIMTAQSATTETFNKEIDLQPSDAAGTGDLSGKQEVILQKFYHLKDFTWNHSKKPYYETELAKFPHGLFPRDLDTIYVLAQFFQFFCFYRFGVVIKITCNFSPGCSGILIVFYEPISLAPALVERRNPMSTRILPHTTINAKSASEGQFTIPYNNETRMYSDTMRNVGSIKKIDWAPLANVAGTQSDTTLSMWFRLIDVEVASLSVSRQPFTTAEYADTKRSFQRALNISMEKHGNGLEFLTDFLEQVVLTGVERKCLSSLKEEMVKSVRNLQTTLEEAELDSEVGDEVENFAMVTANTVNCQSKNVPVHDLSFDGDVMPETNSFASHQPFQLSDYLETPTAIKIVRVTTSTSAGVLLFHFPVTPDYCFSESTNKTLAMSDTPASAMCKHFGYWRGALKVTIEDAASRLHSFRYKVIYVPNVTTMKARDTDYASCQTVTCDIGLQEIVSMAVSFQSPTDWKRTIDFHDRVANFTAKCSELKYSTGQIGIYVMNPLNATSACSQHIDLIVQTSWAIELAYPIFQYDHIKMVQPSLLDSEVGDAQGTMVGSSSDEGSGGVAFDTNKPLPPTYMGNHMNLNKMMTRPVYLDTFTFDNSAVEQTIDLYMQGHQAHLNALAAYYRARPILHVFARHSGYGIKGGMIIGFTPKGFHPFGTDGNTYLESARLLLTNGGYYMNMEQEKTAVFTIPFYRDTNFLTSGESFGNVKFFPVNANGVIDIYLSWSSDYKQYFPNRVPTTYHKHTSSVKPSHFCAEKEEPKKDLTMDGDVEENPGPIQESWADILNEYLSISHIAEVMDQEIFITCGDEIVAQTLYHLTKSELEVVLGYYIELNVEQEDYDPPQVSYAVQMALLEMILKADGEETVDWGQKRLTFSRWLESFNTRDERIVVPPHYLIYLSEGGKPVPSPRDIVRDEHWEDLEDDCLNWLDLGAFEQDERQKTQMTIATLHGVGIKSFEDLRSMCGDGEPWRFQEWNERRMWHEAAETRLIREGIVNVDPGRPLWLIAGENMFVGRPEVYREPDPREFLENMVKLDQQNHPEDIVVAYDTQSTEKEYMFVLQFDPQLLGEKFIRLWMQHGEKVSYNRFQVKQLTKVSVGIGPFQRFVYPGIPDLRILILLAGDVETNPGPVWSKMNVQQFQIEVKEIFDKYSHKKLHIADCPLQFINMLKQNIAFNVLRFEEMGVSQTKRWCSLKVKIDLREQMDFNIKKVFEEEFTSVGPNKKEPKNNCADQFIYKFKNFLKGEELDRKIEATGLEHLTLAEIVANEFDSEGLFDGIMDGITDKLVNKEPVVKMLQAVESITNVIGRVDAFVSEGVGKVVAILSMVVKIILGVVNISQTPTLRNVGFVIANFILDIVSNSHLSAMAAWALDKMKTCATHLFSSVMEWMYPKGESVVHEAVHIRQERRNWDCGSQDTEMSAREKLDEDLEDEMDGEGATDIMSMLVSLFLIMVTGLTGMNESLGKCNFGKVVSKICAGMKNVSVLGNGVRGMSNIIEYVGKAIHGVVSYVKGGVSQDERANVYFQEHKDEIADWSVKVDTFKGTYNENDLRIQPEMRSVIDELYRRGCAIHSGCLFAKDAGSVYTKLTINFKDVSEWQDVANKGKRGVQGRPEPTVILFRGTPGQGKSLLTTRLSSHFAQFFGRTMANGVHACNPFADHMDNYAQQPVVVMDDLGQDAEGGDFENFCQLVSTVPFYPKMADLKQKGDQYISPLLIATTNTMQPKPKSINTIDAVWRRFAFIINVEAVITNDKGELDVQKAMKEDAWADMSCIKLTRFAKIDDEEGTQITLNTLTELVEEELVKRQKNYNAIVENIPLPKRLFAEMMDSHCGECHDQHDINCYCPTCVGLGTGVLNWEEFKEARTGRLGALFPVVQTGYEGLTESVLKETLSATPLYIIQGFNKGGLTEFLWADIVKNCDQTEYFVFRRALEETARRVKKSKLLLLWEKHGPKTKGYLVTAGKMCAGLLVILATVGVFQFLFYVRASKRDQKIQTNRANTCRTIHRLAKWLASKGLTCVDPKHEMAPKRATIPKYIEMDQLVFDAGEEITYHDACVLVEEHECDKCMVHYEETDEYVKKWGSSYDFEAQSEGVYSGFKGKTKPGRSRFAKAAARPFQSQVGEDNGNARDEVAVAISRNVVAVHVDHQDPSRNGHGIATFLSGTEVIMPHHLLSKRGSDDIIQMRFDVGTDGSKDIEFDPERCVSFGDGDEIEDFVIYSLKFPIFGVRKLQTNLFPLEDDFASVVLGGITMISRRKHTPWLVSTPTVVLVKEKEYQDGHFKVTKGLGYALSPDQRGSGDSGALILSRHGVVKNKICGMHVAGHSAAGIALPLTYEFIHNARSVVAAKFGKKHIQAPIELDGVMDSNMADLEITGVNSYLGKVKKFPVSIMRRTQIKPSLVHGCVDILRQPAPLSANDPRVLEEFKKDPVNNAPIKFANGSGHANSSHLSEVIDHTSNVVKSLINHADPPRVLNDFEMVNGLPLGEAFQQVEMSSSPGWPYAQIRVGGKKPWFTFIGTSGSGNEYEMSPVIATRVEERERLARSRTRIDESFFTTFLKDELRPIYKIEQNSARTVECGPLDHLLLARKYFGHFLNVVTKNPIKAFGSCVGINPEVDMSFAETYLREYSDSGMAEDYTLWDGTIKPELIWAAGRVIENFYRSGLKAQIEKEPQNKEALEYQFMLDQNVRDVLLDEIAFTIHISGTELSYAPTGLPSGHFFTSILNSLIHRILNGLAWMKGTEKELVLNTMAEFEEHVRDLHYGDDGKDAVKRGVLAFYNRIVKGAVAAGLGMIYTMEDKQSKMVPISKLDDCGFLKRKSVKHPHSRFLWNVPIEKRTIHSLINWVRENGHLEDNLKEAFREAYHWGEEYYILLKETVESALCKRNVIYSVPMFEWQDRAFKGRMAMSNNPYMVKQVITPAHLSLGRMIAANEEDVVSTLPLVWECKTEAHSHVCDCCGRVVFGLTKTLLGNICIACDGGEEPENYARPSQLYTGPTKEMILMNKYLKEERHHVSNNTWCPSLEMGNCSGGAELRHHWCRECHKLALHLESFDLQGNQRRLCAGCKWGYTMPPLYYHKICEVCEPHLNHPHMNAREIVAP